MLMHRAALNRHVGPERGERLLGGRAVDHDEFRRLQATFDQIVEERPPGLLLSPPMLDRQQHLLAVLPDAQRHEKRIDVAFLSSRTHTTVPSRMSRTIGSSFRERAFQASQSPFTLRQVRLTTSLPTAPENRRSARRTRRVWSRTDRRPRSELRLVVRR